MLQSVTVGLFERQSNQQPLRIRSSPAPAHLALGADVLKQRQVGGSELSDALQASLVDDGYQVQIMRLGEAVR